jgi:hypothetical protein
MWRQKGALPHEDRLEAVAGACQYFVDLMSQDADKARDDHNEELRLREYEEWMENAVGPGLTKSSYSWN